MDKDTILVSLALLPKSLRLYIGDIIEYANQVDSVVSFLDTRINKGSVGGSIYLSSSSSSGDLHSSTSSGNEERNAYSKCIVALKRLYLCFCDIVDLLDNSVQTEDTQKQSIIYLQLEPSVVLLKSTLTDIESGFAEMLRREGMKLDFAGMVQILTAFQTEVHREVEATKVERPVVNRPNILLLLTSGIAYREVEDSIRRYIPRCAVYPCADTVAPFSYEDKKAEHMEYGAMEGLEIDELNELGFGASRSASPTIGRPVQFPNLAHFAQHALSLPQHYMACGGDSPGRATLLTGQYPSTHGVRTSLEKTGGCSELKVGEVPTLGHYLSCLGYDVEYRGEWGLSDVRCLQEHPLFDLFGVEQDSHDDLQPYGFQGWEVHRESDWLEKNRGIADEALAYLRRREGVMNSSSLRGGDPPPWALIVSFSDVMSGESEPIESEQIIPNTATDMHPFSFSCGNLREIPVLRKKTAKLPSSEDSEGSEGSETLEGPRGPKGSRGSRTPKTPKAQQTPKVQQVYEAYCKQQGTRSLESMYRSHAKQLDEMVGEILQELEQSSMANTVVLVTATTGNLIGAHGLWGCCYNAYEDAIHIPCLLSIPAGLAPPLLADRMTSSVDVLPSLLQLIQADVSTLQDHLRQAYGKVYPLVGRDVRDRTELNMVEGWSVENSIYYQNEDVAMPLQRSQSYSEKMNEEWVVQTPHRSVSAAIVEGKHEGADFLYKICFYSSDPRSCMLLSKDDTMGEWELFDLLRDRKECRNLWKDATDPDNMELCRFMKTCLVSLHHQLCIHDQRKTNEESRKLSWFSLDRWRRSERDIKWYQFYFLVIALIVSIVAMIIHIILTS